MKITFRNTRCYNCGHECNMVTSTQGDDVPEDGDVSICIECAAIGFYDSSMPDGLQQLCNEQFVGSAKNVSARAVCVFLRC